MVDGGTWGVDHHRFAVDFNHAARGFAYAEDQLRQLRTPGPNQPGQPDNFTGSHLQTARLHFFAVGQVMDVQARTSQRDIALFIKQVT
ncbi:hypothetical protein D3C71_1315820 [compost metagenome]